MMYDVWQVVRFWLYDGSLLWSHRDKRKAGYSIPFIPKE